MTMDIPEPRNNDVQSVSSRRMRKREVDRRCQREARDRTRARIAQLEALVDDLRRKDVDGQVTALLEQLKTMQAERDTAVKTLKSIQQLIDQRPLKQVSGIEKAPATLPLHDALSRPDSTSDGPTGQPELQQEAYISNDSSGVMGEPDPHDVQQCSEVFEGSNQRFLSQTLAPVTDVRPEIYNWVKPQLRCCCHDHADRLPGRSAVWQGNFWHFISDVLDERFNWTAGTQPAEDIESEDLAVRAVVEGWDAVAQRGPLHPSWQMLRRIDEATFGPIAKVERLAMLRAMHLLIQYHTQPTAERYTRLPSWYMYRPSQHIKHAYAMEYWAWPTFRQRFFLNPHAYCGNDFFFQYQNQLQLLWPFEFRDCYTHDLETGLYKPSRMFDERMNDIRCWTMGPDFFQRFPELSSDIAASTPRVPRLLSSATEPRKRQLRRPALVGKRRTPEQDTDAFVHTASQARHETQLRMHSSQSHTELADDIPAVSDGSSMEETAFSPSYEWHQFPQCDSDYPPMSSTFMNASIPLAMSELFHASDTATLTESMSYFPANGSLFMDDFIAQ